MEKSKRKDKYDVHNHISVKPTIAAEASCLAQIQKEAFLPLYDQFHDKGNPCLRGPEDILKRLNDTYRYYTIFYDDIIIGGIFYRLSGKMPSGEELIPGEYYLQRVYIKPHYQSMGIAQQAIIMCEREFVNATAFYVDFPEILGKNRMCYQKAGYHDTGKRIILEGTPLLAVFKKLGSNL